METFNSAFGKRQLERIPLIRNDNLRAWDAADELLLNQLSEQGLPLAEHKILLVNDNFAALACALQGHNIQSWSDSYIAHLALQSNFKLNGFADSTLPLPVASTTVPQDDIDIVLLKVPKTLALLEEQLKQLRALLKPDSLIIAGAMIKHLPGSAIQLFEDILGPTHTSLARKKARLIFSKLDTDKEITASAYPHCYFEKDVQLQLSNHANVFSKEKLDIGARFMLQQFQHLPTAGRVIDLGCGNGVLGILAQRQLPNAEIHFVDESYMAIASAQQNYHTEYPRQQAFFHTSNSLSQASVESPDLIICNPPFHQQHSIGDQIAWNMLKQGHAALNKGGAFWLVGNRNMAYHVKMQRLFGNCTTVASNKKFVVLSSVKS